MANKRKNKYKIHYLQDKETVKKWVVKDNNLLM